MVLPPLSLGRIFGSAAVAIDESESDQGQVLLLGGKNDNGGIAAAVYVVDLATGVCTPQPPLLSTFTPHEGFSVTGVQVGCTAARLADGRVVCVGNNSDYTHPLQGMAQVIEPPPPPEHGSPSNDSWKWRHLPAMSIGRAGGRGCVLSECRFAVFGGSFGNKAQTTASCEVLTPDGDIERWDPLPPMREARQSFACAAIGECVIVAGGVGSHPLNRFVITAEVYEEAAGRWRRLPCSLPNDGQLHSMGSAVM
jgi:hypothetical protein